jgi:hypothetical protein
MKKMIICFFATYDNIQDEMHVEYVGQYNTTAEAIEAYDLYSETYKRSLIEDRIDEEYIDECLEFQRYLFYR